MKKIALSLLFGICLIATAWTTDDPVVRKVDLNSSNMFWKGYKVTGSHEGTINIKGGELHFQEGILVDGIFSIDMASIACSDLGEGGKAKLEGHLKSGDFFNVAEFPEANLDFTKVVSRGTEGSYKIIADLTIKGITKSVKFNIITEDGAMKSKIVIDRSDYDVRYGSGSFFDNLGNKTIYDEFDIAASITLMPAQ